MKKYFVFLFILCIMYGSQPVFAGNKVPQLGKYPVDKVIAAMTLEEKAQLLVGGGRREFSVDEEVKSYNFVPGAAGNTVAIPRLGIPETVETDGPAGVRIDSTRKGDTKTYYCTGFPIPSLLASTWNTDLVSMAGKAMGNEVREYGCDILLAPGLNLQRNPLCGRNFEYYSEDPLLAGKMAAAIVKGVQSEGVGTSIKHFACNNQETFRGETSSNVSQRALRELYLKGFEIAVKEAQPWAVMASYNKLNGVYTQEDYSLLTTLLRDEWGYKGIVMTDWTGTRNTVAQVHTGSDLLMPGFEEQVKNIVEAVKEGKLSQADVDRNVKRVLELVLKTPRFRQYAYTNRPDLKVHAGVVRNTADEGIVLLKNDNHTLPFRSGIKNIALFGVGSYYFLTGGSSGSANKAYSVNLEQGLENAGFKLEPELKSFYDQYLIFQNDELNVVKRTLIFPDEAIPEEIKLNRISIELRSRNSDAAILTFFRQAGENEDRHNTEGDFLLTQTEKDMLKDVCETFHAQHKKVIVVLNTGGVVETASWKYLPDAIVLAWQPGQEGGNSVVDILKGAVDPSGKLPMTFPVDYFDVPSSKNFPYNYQGERFDPKVKNIGHTDYEEGIWVGYRYFNTENKPVSYPFGYGLSYTSFEYSNAGIKKTSNGYTVRVKITNTGKTAGKEVAELYISAPKGNLEKPACELKAFAKTKLLQAGESEILSLRFTVPDLASFDETSNSWVTDAGEYKVLIGSSVDDIRQTVPLKIGKTLIIKVKAKI